MGGREKRGGRREKRGGKREKKGRKKEERERGNGEKRTERETDTPCTLPLKQRGLDTIQIEPSLFFYIKALWLYIIRSDWFTFTILM